MTHGDSTTVPTEQLVNWITRQRWFGDKARPITAARIEMSESVRAHSVPVVLRVVRFSFEWGPDALYFVPMQGEGDEAAGEQDILENEQFLRWFVEGFAQERSLQGNGTWRWRTLGNGIPDLDTVDYTNARLISAEQSNSSIVFDRRFIGKVFRRVQPGLNPDLEIGEFLSEGDRFSHAPQLYGLIEVERDGDLLAIAAIQEYIPNRGDGWSWLLEALRGSESAVSSDLTRDIRTLGTRTAELHVALASDPSSRAFAPEPFTSTDAEALVGRVITEIQESVEGLARTLPPHEVEQIHKGMGQLMGDAHALVGTYKIRVHGDYHLGQTLRTVDDDFVLIDFEGEPSRSMEQRRMKLSALKDVAGMVRSLDYAGATILMNVEDRERRATLEMWLKEAVDAYVSAYREAVASASVPLVPDDGGDFSRTLALQIAEKALYEVRYEMNNRPDWLPIPLNALRRLVGIAAPMDTA